MRLKEMDRSGLIDYLERQLAFFFPDGRPVKEPLNRHLDDALFRLGRCIDRIRMWRKGEFDYLHSSQYALFLYFLANTIWRQEGDESRICTKLFFLNKTLNGLDCFFEIEMPEIFFIGHTAGIVLAKAAYGDYLVLYQNCTVGKNHGVAPVLEQGVIMYPHTAIIGRCRVKRNTVISQGTSVVNQDTPGESIVFPGSGRGLVSKPLTRNILEDFFRF